MEQYKNCAVTQLMQKSVPDFQRRPSAAYLSALTNDAATIEADYLTQQFTLIQKAVLLRRGAGFDADLFAAL